MELRLPPRQHVRAPVSRVRLLPVGRGREPRAAPPVSVCAKPLQGAAPFPRGFDRRRRAPRRPVALACAAPADARYGLLRAVRHVAVRGAGRLRGGMRRDRRYIGYRMRREIVGERSQDFALRARWRFGRVRLGGCDSSSGNGSRRGARRGGAGGSGCSGHEPFDAASGNGMVARQRFRRRQATAELPPHGPPAPRARCWLRRRRRSGRRSSPGARHCRGGREGAGGVRRRSHTRSRLVAAGVRAPRRLIGRAAESAHRPCGHADQSQAR